LSCSSGFKDAHGFVFINGGFSYPQRIPFPRVCPSSSLWAFRLISCPGSRPDLLSAQRDIPYTYRPTMGVEKPDDSLQDKGASSPPVYSCPKCLQVFQNAFCPKAHGLSHLDVQHSIFEARAKASGNPANPAGFL